MKSIESTIYFFPYDYCKMFKNTVPLNKIRNFCFTNTDLLSFCTLLFPTYSWTSKTQSRTQQDSRLRIAYTCRLTTPGYARSIYSLLRSLPRIHPPRRSRTTIISAHCSRARETSEGRKDL